MISFLKYGFPLDIPQPSEFEPNLVVTNHSIATQYPASIYKYLQVEIANKAILGC